MKITILYDNTAWLFSRFTVKCARIFTGLKDMKTLQTKINWVDDVIPEGLPLKSTTVITGPDGSGKPLIGETFVPAWLKKGGSIIFMSLQYPSTEFITESIKNVTGLDHIKEIADHSRSKVIPAILKIIEN